MRTLIISDVHSNLAALEAVLRQASRDGPIDAVWNLGDTVGYGPQPSQCIGRLEGLAAVSVVGNHDLAAAGTLDTSDFNPDAARAAIWTRERLSPGERARLAALPQISRQENFTLVHGTLREPVWEYLYSQEAAQAHLARQETPFGLVGHTHVPTLVAEEGGSPRLYRLADGDIVLLELGRRLILNPGGVGQPRDGDPRAAYAVLDAEAMTITFRRVEYDIAATQRIMAEAGLPPWLIQRLSLGR